MHLATVGTELGENSSQKTEASLLSKYAFREKLVGVAIDSTLEMGRTYAMKPHFQMMAEYNAWANERLYRMASQVPDERYRRDVGTYFGSLHRTLNHIMCADLIWMRRLTGLGEHPTRLDAILFDDFPALSAARVREDRRIVDYVDSLSDVQMEETWVYQTLNGASRRQRRREILAHLFNHQTHHRGQAHAILTVLGVREPDGLDLLLMQWERPLSKL